MFRKRSKRPTPSDWTELPPDVLDSLARMLQATAATAIQSAPILAVSPGSPRSAAFQQRAYQLADALRAAGPGAPALEDCAKAISETWPEFGEWQRNEVAQLVEHLAQSIRDTASRLGEAVEEQAGAVGDLQSVHTQLAQAQHSDDLATVRQALTAGIESTKRLIDRQRDFQAKIQRSYEETVEDLEVRLDEAQEASQTDHLTSLANRASFDYFAEAIIQKVRHGEGPYTFAMIDLDGFKDINDANGHIAGDLALNAFANLLKQHLGQGTYLARFGGDEFAAILSGPVKTLAQRLNALAKTLARRPCKLVSEDIAILANIRFSAGVVTVLPTDSVKGLVGRADEFLYTAKRNGKARVCEEGAQHAA